MIVRAGISLRKWFSVLGDNFSPKVGSSYVYAKKFTLHFLISYSEKPRMPAIVLPQKFYFTLSF